MYIKGQYLDASIASLVAAFHMAGCGSGLSQGIDPGRPKVPVFGRRLYSLALPRKTKSHGKLSQHDAAIIERKAGMPISHLETFETLDSWRKSLAAFRKKLACAKFSAAVFDYDRFFGRQPQSIQASVPPQ